MSVDETSWKRPSDIMKNRRRKSVSQKRIKVDSDQRTSIIYKSPSKSVKRKNPFYKDSPHPFATKRVCTENVEGVSDPLSCQLFTMLDSANNPEDEPTTSHIDEKGPDKVTPAPSLDTIPEDPVAKEAVKQNKATIDVQDEPEIFSYLPVDWSLKTKVRVVSSRPLDWCVQIRTADESHGVTQFVQDSQCRTDSLAERKQSFQRGCMYWVHPNIPWMKLFPRIADEAKSSSFSYLLQEDVQKGLQVDWEQSFTSVYHQLRSGLCPYFYLCTHQFTVLFHNSSQSKLVAMVTPTTRGFRESLDNEGIEFSLPVGAKSKSPQTTIDAESDQLAGEDNTAEDKENTCGDEDLSDTDEAASGWLESMGLDKKQFPSLDPKKVKLQREGFRVIDNRPESLVSVEGPNVQALFNFLLNCRTCTASSGIQAGLPPTILSPKPFIGATLKSHRVKHTAVKQSDADGNITKAHIVEVSGPILPSHCQHLVALYHTSQAADFGMVFNNHDLTTPFNILPRVVNLGALLSARIGTEGSSPEVKEAKGESQETTTEGFQSEEEKWVCGGNDIGNSSPAGKNDVLCAKIDNVEGKATDLLNAYESDSLSSKLFRHVPISDRVTAMKELVCTPTGFSWKS